MLADGKITAESIDSVKEEFAETAKKIEEALKKAGVTEEAINKAQQALTDALDKAKEKEAPKTK